MRKYISLIISLLILTFFSTSIAQENEVVFSKSYPFVGSLDRSVPYIAQTGAAVREVLNMKRITSGIPAGWKLRSGVTKHHTTTIQSGAEIESLHQFRNNEHDINCLIAQANDKLILADEYPPTTGGASFGSSILDLTTGSDTTWSARIGDDWVGVASGSTPFSWSGGTAYPDTFIVDRESGTTNYHNGTPFIRNNSTLSNFTIIQDNTETLYFGFRRRIDGLYLDFVSGTTNDTASGITIYARRSGAWTAVSGQSDGTNVGGDTFKQSGLISWTGSTLDEAYVLPKTSDHLYWYKLVTTANIDDGVKVYRVRVTEDCQEITELWSGQFDIPLSVLMSNATGYENWTLETTDGSQYNYMDAGGLTSSYAVYVGFLYPAFGIGIQIDPEYYNYSTASGVSVYYWNGVSQTWTDVGSVDDGTKEGSYALNHTGTLQWDASSIDEDQRILGGEDLNLYYYKLVWSATLPDDLYIWDIAALQKPENSPSFPDYDGIIEYNGRALFWPGKEHRSGFDFSKEGYAYILNGPDAGTTGNIFGPGTINAATKLHSYAIVSTRDPYQTYILEGKTPATFDELRISSTIGCLAPKTMLTIEDNVRLFNDTRNVHTAIFLSHDGIYLSDGMTVINISGPIADLFDDGSAPYFESDYADDSYAWIDHTEKTVHFAVPINTSGSGTQTTLNREIVYSYLNNEWLGQVSRGAPASCGLDVVTSDNQRLPFIGDYSGYVHRTVLGQNNDNGSAINHYIRTSDFTPLEIAESLNYQIRLRGIKVKGKAQSSGNIDITVYPDDKSTGIDLSDDISMVHSGYGHFMNKIITNETGESFSIKFEAGASSAETMEIYGYTIDYAPIRETQ